MGTFGERLRELRNERGISQNELSKYIGVSKSSVNMYERGEREPGFETLEAIADFFNINMDYLLGRESRISSSREDLHEDTESIISRVADEYKLSKEERRILALFLKLDDPARSALLGYASRLAEEARNNPSKQDVPMDIDSQLERYRHGMLMGIATAQTGYSVRPEDIDIDSITLTPELSAMVDDALEKQRHILEAEMQDSE